MERRGHTLFCDDIRHEVGNKISYIGCYTGDIIFRQELPATFSKIGFSITLETPADYPFQQITVKILLPGDDYENPSLTGNLSISQTDKIDRQNDEIEGEEKIHKLVNNVVVESLEVKREGYIRVRADCDGEIIKCGSIRVRHQNIYETDRSKSTS